VAGSARLSSARASSPIPLTANAKWSAIAIIGSKVGRKTRSFLACSTHGWLGSAWLEPAHEPLASQTSHDFREKIIITH
jgi:hypothetical protein